MTWMFPLHELQDHIPFNVIFYFLPVCSSMRLETETCSLCDDMS